MTDRAEHHAEALDVLHDALSAAVNARRRVPCRVPGWAPLWTSDDHEERHEAAEACAPCPIITPCRAAGEFERFGTWGGRDVTPTKSKPIDRQEISQ